MSTINERAGLAANPKTAEAMLRDLGVDKSVKVRSAVAGNPGTPVDVLEALANDVRWQVRFAVADNPNPAAIRSALSSRYADVRGLVSQRNDLDAATRRQVLQDPDFRVRIAMAEGCSDPETLTALAHDEHPLVRSCAVLNRWLPAAVVEAAAGDRRGPRSGGGVGAGAAGDSDPTGTGSVGHGSVESLDRQQWPTGSA